jgi:UDP-4-amino-4,6-dideoxy-N-acetyl-beta-L-altrosamine N-acetyltransferase
MKTENSCRIRPAGDADLAQMLVWRNQPQVRANMLTQHEISAEEHRQWYERTQQDATRLLLIVEENGAPLGFVNFADVQAGAASTWGFYAAPGAEKGAGAKIGATALEFAFNTLEIHKVCGRALAFNEASIRMHERLGFCKEGVLRQQQKINETYHDIICFGLMRDEWNGK